LIIDGGAYDGEDSAELLSHLGEEGKLFAYDLDFSPLDTGPYSWLRNHNKVKLIRKALGSTSGTVSIAVDNEKKSYSHVVTHHSQMQKKF
jgi:hypothetical protein